MANSDGALGPSAEVCGQATPDSGLTPRSWQIRPPPNQDISSSLSHTGSLICPPTMPHLQTHPSQGQALTPTLPTSPLSQITRISHNRVSTKLQPTLVHMSESSHMPRGTLDDGNLHYTLGFTLDNMTSLHFFFQNLICWQIKDIFKTHIGQAGYRVMVA